LRIFHAVPIATCPLGKVHIGTQNVRIVVDAGLCRDGKSRPGSFDGFENSQPYRMITVSERDPGCRVSPRYCTDLCELEAAFMRT